MRKFVLLLLICLFASQSYASANKKVYVWRNADGVIVFSDSPKADVNADTVDISTTPNIIKSVDTKIIEGTEQPAKDKISIDIVKPTIDETIRDNTGSVYISGAIRPSFKRGLSVVLKLDDKKVKGPQKSAVFILRDVDRGEHRIQLEVWNDSGKVIAVSKPVTFFVHRASVNSPN
ncbi:DUF4124 domain-containing protein [Psychrosphaera haliotis]|uniref:DUF4124 domain-containing protein n=1 Tax=Psychrosphaera haliotis TaxID=555083 RepID=A0A6N8FAX6_9GAMM|nr:DUF4124 domain-containing protein [Psychrosphaera haliotis]MDB2373214.1 DUF4124 domain-containing protein [Psychrosphaera haliotis]MUH72659.1 DUF4124 domain-containing protein [Psychrosphaera haliotis]